MGSRPRRAHSRLGGAAVLTGSGEAVRKLRGLSGRQRLAAPLSQDISNSEVIVFEDCSHTPIYENVKAFNEQTLAFLQRH
jgi:pimeloyl-ACP methyl ester carboxylesterase